MAKANKRIAITLLVGGDNNVLVDEYISDEDDYHSFGSLSGGRGCKSTLFNQILFCPFVNDDDLDGW